MTKKYINHSNNDVIKIDTPKTSDDKHKQEIFFTSTSAKFRETNKSESNLNMDPTSAISASKWDKKKISYCSLILNTFQAIFDLSLFASKTFDLVCSSIFLYQIGFFVPYTYSPSHSREKFGVGKSQSRIPLFTMGVSNIVGRVLAGWLSDRSCTNSLILNNSALVLSGLSTIFIPFSKSFIVFNAYAALYGLCMGTFITLRSVILVDLLGVERLSKAFGMLILFQGIGTAIGTPIGGAIKDKTNSLSVVFMFAGSTFLGACIIGIIAKKISMREKKNSDFDSNSINQEVTNCSNETL